jgi:hypothetical protein
MVAGGVIFVSQRLYIPTKMAIPECFGVLPFISPHNLPQATRDETMDNADEPRKSTPKAEQSDAQAGVRKSSTGEFYLPEQFNEPSGEKKKHHLHWPGHKSGEPHEPRKPSTGEFYQPDQFAYSSEHHHKNKAEHAHEPRKPSTGEFYQPDQFAYSSEHHHKNKAEHAHEPRKASTGEFYQPEQFDK